MAVVCKATITVKMVAKYKKVVLYIYEVLQEECNAKFPKYSKYRKSNARLCYVNGKPIMKLCCSLTHIGAIQNDVYICLQLKLRSLVIHYRQFNIYRHCKCEKRIITNVINGCWIKDANVANNVQLLAEYQQEPIMFSL